MIFIISLNHATYWHIQSGLYIWSILQCQINCNNYFLRLCVLYMCVVHAHVCEGSYTYMCKEGHRKTMGVLLYHPLPYCPETWSLTEHGTGSWPTNPSIFLSLPQPVLVYGWIQVHTHTATPRCNKCCSPLGQLLMPWIIKIWEVCL